MNQGVIVAPRIHPIGPRATIHHIRAAPANDPVMARATINGVIVTPAVDEIIAAATLDGIAPASAINPVVTRAAQHRIVTTIRNHQIVARPRINVIIATTGIDDVGTVRAIQAVAVVRSENEWRAENMENGHENPLVKNSISKPGALPVQTSRNGENKCPGTNSQGANHSFIRVPGWRRNYARFCNKSGQKPAQAPYT